MHQANTLCCRGGGILHGNADICIMLLSRTLYEQRWSHLDNLNDKHRAQRLFEFHSLLRMSCVLVTLLLVVGEYFELEVELADWCGLLIPVFLGCIWMVAFNDLLGTERFRRPLTRRQRRHAMMRNMRAQHAAVPKQQPLQRPHLSALIASVWKVCLALPGLLVAEAPDLWICAHANLLGTAHANLFHAAMTLGPSVVLLLTHIRPGGAFCAVRRGLFALSTVITEASTEPLLHPITHVFLVVFLFPAVVLRFGVTVYRRLVSTMLVLFP
jgi:hypothetical protein